jgi:hypothetical protein
VRLFNHLLTIPFPRAALLFFFFGVVSTKDGNNSISDEIEGIREVHDEVGWARSAGDAEVDGSQGKDQDGRKVWVKAAKRGATVDKMTDRDAGDRDEMAVILAMVYELKDVQLRE